LTLEEQFDALLSYARQEPDVLGVYVFGSRARQADVRDEHSDYDVAVVLSDRPGAVEAFDARWPYTHGAAIEIARSTLSELRGLGEYGADDEWSRYLYTRVDLILDKTGEIESILRSKDSVPEDVREGLVKEHLNAYINSTYRSLRYRMVGLEAGARLDAAESLPHLLTALFALEGRVRPFNKFLEPELRERPLEDTAFDVDRLLPQLLRVLEGDADEQAALFRDVERIARARGFGEIIDGWQPDVPWLRGEAGFREA
jgi:hypothetical protein